MIPSTRLITQQLLNPSFNNAKDLVSWMGAIQGQDYTMVKWALGVRLQASTYNDVQLSFQRADIIRTHILRPTWHLVAAEDLRWMLSLSGERLSRSCKLYGDKMISDKKVYTKIYNLFEKLLAGNNHLTKQEINTEIIRIGIPTENHLLNNFLMAAEGDGIICSGADKGNKPTFALLEERVPPQKKRTKQEALAELALRYFKSHSPASFNDFLWWSGLNISEAREAVNLLGSDLIKDRFAGYDLYIHQSCPALQEYDDLLHFLPPYDEYLISYKDRTAALELVHHPKAFTNYGIFYPVIMYNGRIVGNWKKISKKGTISIETIFFDKKTKVKKALLKAAEERYKAFYSSSSK